MLPLNSRLEKFLIFRDLILRNNHTQFVQFMFITQQKIYTADFFVIEKMMLKRKKRNEANFSSIQSESFENIICIK